jgi:hypothetical protein
LQAYSVYECDLVVHSATIPQRHNTGLFLQIVFAKDCLNLCPSITREEEIVLYVVVYVQRERRKLFCTSLSIYRERGGNCSVRRCLCTERGGNCSVHVQNNFLLFLYIDNDVQNNFLLSLYIDNDVQNNFLLSLCT